MAISDVLNSSKLGLFASQGAMKVISHNIANVNTKGYSRQTISLEANPGIVMSGLQTSSGDGVQIARVGHQVDDLLERRLRMGSGDIGRLAARDRFMTVIENNFNEIDGDGLSDRFNAFFDAVDDAVSNPSNPAARIQVVSRSQGLANTVNQMSRTLEDIAVPVDQEITGVIGDINTKLRSLQEINTLIVRQSAGNRGGDAALDLADQRTGLLQELNELIDIQSIEQPDAGVTIVTLAGQLLLDHDYVAQLGRGRASSGEMPSAIVVDGNIDVDITTQIRSGALKGLLEVRDEILGGDRGLISQFEQLTSEFRQQVNAVYAQSVGHSMNQRLTATTQVNPDVPLRDIFGASIRTDEIVSPDGAVAPREIVFAYGSDVNNLNRTGSRTISITGETTLRGLIDEINGSGSGITARENNGQLVIDAGEADRFAVFSDTSGVLTALGVGTLFSGSNAANMAVNPELLVEKGGDPGRLATARIRTDSSGNVRFDDSNNSGMVALAALRSQRINLLGERATFASHYATLVSQVGSIQQRNQDALTTQRTAQQFLSDNRESVSGVSLDEELTDMVKFQRAFQASSRMVSVADELFKSILSMGV
ncbi:MAG: flagellar hook-associated protein FlgK [Magnetococcales bacterium]|nr:flagellar hook-associated protein FlgK [Magnetococcales bacterium]